MTGGRGRGRLIAFGITEERDAPAIKTRRVVAAWTFEAFLILLAEGVLLLSSSVGDVQRLVNTIGAVLLTLVGLLIITLVGVEFDGIYESGISSRNATLWETMTRRGFQPYSEITTVGRIPKSKRRPAGLILLVEGGKGRIGPFWDEYSNDFFRRLESTLETTCPSARRIEVPVEESLVRRQISWREARRASRPLTQNRGSRQ